MGWNFGIDGAARWNRMNVYLAYILLLYVEFTYLTCIIIGTPLYTLEYVGYVCILSYLEMSAQRGIYTWE